MYMYLHLSVGFSFNADDKKDCVATQTITVNKTIFRRGFIAVFSRRETGFHLWAKRFELRFFLNEINVPLNSQTRQAKSSHSWAICQVPYP